MSWRGLLRRAGINVDGPGGNLNVEGILTAQNLVGIQGKRIYWDPADGGTTRNGRSVDDAVSTIALAYAKLTAGQNDTLVYLSGDTSGKIVDTVTWAKSYTHMIGVGAPTGVANRARIFDNYSVDSAGTLAGHNILKVTASGCIFANLYIFNGTQVATSYEVEVTGSRNYFYRVHFAGMGHATPAGNATNYSLKLNGGSENLFEECTIGIDTIKRTAANRQLYFDGSATRNVFRNCKFISWSETAAHPIVELADASACDRYNIFENCLFYNFWTNHADKLSAAFKVPASPATNDIILKGDCMLVGIDEWEANDRGNVWISCAAPTAASSGIAVEPAT